MTPAVFKKSVCASIPKTVSGCLRSLGVPFKVSTSFWLANGGELEWILKDALAAWRDKIKKAHSDHGGTHAESVRLNLIRDRVVAIFRSHGVTLDNRIAEKPLKEVAPRKTRKTPSERSAYIRNYRFNARRAKAGIPLDAPRYTRAKKASFDRFKWYRLKVGIPLDAPRYTKAYSQRKAVWRSVA